MEYILYNIYIQTSKTSIGIIRVVDSLVFTLIEGEYFAACFVVTKSNFSLTWFQCWLTINDDPINKNIYKKK